MKLILITGARDYRDIIGAGFVLLDHIDYSGTELYHGNARGIDKELAAIFTAHAKAELEYWRCQAFPAEWAKYNKAAGPIRNQEMVNYIEQKRLEGHQVICLAFPLLPRRPHSGTWDCIDRIQQMRLPILITPEEFDHGLD